MGRRLSEIAPGFDPDWWEVAGRVLADGHSERQELEAAPLGQWFDVLFWKVRPEDARVAILFRDVTERRRNETSLREARDALALATQASRLGWGTWDFGTGTADWDQRGREIIGLLEDETRTEDWLARVAPEHRAAVEAEIEACVRQGRPFDLEYQVLHRDGSAHQVHGTGVFHLSSDGWTVCGTGLIRDITERRHWEESQRLLVGELNHRVKNMLAVVQSVTRQTQRSSDTIETFSEALVRRIQALASAHALLTRRNWSGADLRELVEETAGTFSAPGDERIRIEGPRVALRPDVTISFAMALHELGTNSLKHGALSAPEGKVEVSWAVGDREDGRVRFGWIETGGPPVRPPKRRGFGTKLLERGIARELSGTVALDYSRDGFRFQLEFPSDGTIISD